jgi:ribosomal-protein-alanine N-acetyltransferase
LSFKIILGQIPVIKTERLFLRPVVKEDASDLLEHYKNKETVEHLDWHGPDSLDEAERLIALWNKWFKESYFICWGITLPESGRLIGTFSYDAIPVRLKAEISYEISREYWNNGLMTEVLKELIPFGFKVLKFQRIQAIVAPENRPSIKVLRRNNFKEEGLLRQYDYNVHEKRLVDVRMFSLIKEDLDLPMDRNNGQ